MNPLSAIFGAGVTLRNALYDRGVFKTRKLDLPVISVGNISVGGSGKTPFVIMLGQLLKARGVECDVLSRGYGRGSTDVSVVDPQGSPEQFGDEPLLIARKLQVPVMVGGDRYEAGLLAEKNFTSQLHLLDDGFQHRRLHRDFDIVMLPASDLQGTLLPVGWLREPLSSLRRADAVVTDQGHGNQSEVSLVREPADSLDTIKLAMELEEQREPALPALAADIWPIQRSIYLDDLAGKPLAFCGIAKPHQFFAHLRRLGIKPTETIAFPDHHHYAENDISRLLRLKASSGAGCFITTEKDQINLGALADRLQPLAIARLSLSLEQPEEAISTLISTLERRCGCRF